MTVLDSELHDDVNISVFFTVMTYINTTGRDLAVLSKVRMGSLAQPIAGGGYYQLKVAIDGSAVLPDAAIPVATQDDVTMQSRHLALENGQTLTVQVQGQPGDTSIDVETVLVDVTPAAAGDLAGMGSVPIDHNYGSIDNLRIVDPSNAGVQDVTISAYLEADYDAGNYTAAFLKGRTKTGADGRWLNPIALNPGDYVLVVAKPGHIQTETVVITVL